MYVFRYDGTSWNAEQRLRDPATDTRRTRGVNDVAVHGDAIAVADVTSTSLYRHDGSSWVEDGTVTGGGAVWMDATTLVAGSYVYERVGGAWVEAQQLTLPASDSELFQIEIEGDWLAAGLDTTPTNSERNGAVLMYRWDGTEWIFDQRIDSETGPEVKQLALRGNEVLLGVPGLNNTGWTNLFEYDGTDWVYVQDIVPWTTGGGDSSDYTQYNIGAGVWLGPDVAIAGAPGIKTCFSCDRVGGGYVFRREPTGWTMTSARLPTGGRRTGYALASDGRWLFAGGSTDDPPFADPFGVVVRVGP